jgi:predicted O-methyltransferase YrrM
MSMSSDDLFVPPGHFYSPIFLPGDSYSKISAPTESEIPMNAQSQIELLRAILPLGRKFPDTPTDTFFYYSSNDQYGDGDAFIFSGIIQYLQPAKVIEIGSGFSTAVLIDTLLSANLSTKVVAIDPFPERLEQLLVNKESLMTNDVSITILPQKVQEVDTSLFSTLAPGDILFIDSSHVSKTGSDVNFELFQIIPKLKSGVWVHIHDMFWPFEYPEAWIQQGRSWNENYIVRAFLTGNSKIQIRFFQQYLFNEHSSEWAAVIEKGVHNPGGGLWIEIL